MVEPLSVWPQRDGKVGVSGDGCNGDGGGDSLCSGEGLGSGQGLGELSAWHAAHAAHSGLPASRMSSHTPAGQTSSQGLGEGLGSGEGEDGREMGHCAQPASWSFIELYSAPAG